MTKVLISGRFILFGWMLCFFGLSYNVWAVTDSIKRFTEIKLGANYATCNSELFNLLSNRKNIIDGKNYYKKSFVVKFDELLLKSQSAKSKDEMSQLKRRLLSGPAAKPRAFKDEATQKMYIYYDACQAHACDKTNLGLLYEAESEQMIAKLTIGGQNEFLGVVSDPEKNLLNFLKPSASK